MYSYLHCLYKLALCLLLDMNGDEEWENSNISLKTYGISFNAIIEYIWTIVTKYHLFLLF